MANRLHELNRTRVLALDRAGKPIVDRQAALDAIGDASAENADMVAIPVERQGDAFFDLKTRLAGEVLQVWTTYRLPVAFIGDLSTAMERSGALRDFIRESNKGRQVWFVDDMAALEAKLATR